MDNIQDNLSKNDYKINEYEKTVDENKFLFIDLCSGIGGFHCAMDRIKEIDSQILFASDIDKNANENYKHNFGVKPYDDLMKLNVLKHKKFNALFAGFPCFPKNTKILTKCGYKNIQDVLLDDKLLTHTGNFQNIKNLQQKYYNKSLYKIRVNYSPYEIKTTEEHPFYVLRNETPLWINAKNLLTSDYVGMPLNMNEIIPEFTFTKKINQYKTENINIKLDEEDQYFMMGYFIGDGWIEENKNKIRFAVNNRQQNELIEKFSKYLNITDKKCDSGKCKKFGCQDFTWFNIFKMFGKYASGKKIPEFIHNAPRHLVKSFIEGYKFADGCELKNHSSISTISHNLAFGLQRLLLKIDIISSLSYSNLPDTTMIEGRTVKQNNFYKIRYFNNHNKNMGFFKDNYFWRKIKTIKVEDTMEMVYNFEVENDNSYCVENVIVHNCQPFSVAGKRMGLDDARGTIIHYILNMVKQRQPELVCLENVKGLKSLKNKDQGGAEVMCYKLIYKSMDDLGYYVTDKVISPSYINIPQERDRVVITCVRKDVVKNDKIIDRETYEKVILSNVEKLIENREEMNEDYNVFQETDEIEPRFRLDCKLKDFDTKDMKEKDLDRLKQKIKGLNDKKSALDLWDKFVSLEEWDKIKNEELIEIYEKHTNKKCKKNFKQEHFFVDFLYYKTSNEIPDELCCERRKKKQICKTFKEKCDMWNILYDNHPQIKKMIDNYLKKNHKNFLKLPLQHRYLEYSGGVDYGKGNTLNDKYCQFRMSGVRIRKGDVFPTLVKSGPMPVIIKDRRYLTNREAARLQSFPDKYDFVGTDHNIMQRLGNAVNVQVIEIMLRSALNIIFPEKVKIPGDDEDVFEVIEEITETPIEEVKTKNYCEVCKKELKGGITKRHLNSKIHKKNEEK
jgi:DNA-cytosine methyltransferase